MPNGQGITGLRQPSTLGWPLDQRLIQGSTQLKMTKGRHHVAALFHVLRIAKSVFAAIGNIFPIDPMGLGKF